MNRAFPNQLCRHTWLGALQRGAGRTRCWSLFVTVLALLAAVGCSQNPLNRQAVSGTVTLDGKPLTNGVISFNSQEGSNYSSGGTITEGKYAIPAEKGLPPGKYLVRINATVPDPRLPAPPEGERDTRPGVAIIPASFNSQSTQIVQIEARPAVDVNFDIPAR